MNSSTKSARGHTNGPIPMLDQVYGIIDSKIQYADYLTQLAIRPFLDQERLKGGATFSHKNSTSNGSPFSDASFLLQIEKTSKAKNLLLIIRAKLCSQNAKTCFDLLTNDCYLMYCDKTLVRILEAALTD
ncbi:MAG: hypothetical protein AAF985_23630 [Bacteroidota bacterium]